jgi:hypothetical protein
MRSRTPSHDSHGSLEDRLPAAIRRFVLLLLTIGVAGTAADLLLLDHYEEIWQLFPLVLLALALVNIGWVVVITPASRSAGVMPAAGSAAVITMRVLMVGFIAAGALGILMHYNGNSEFQREIDPSLGGWTLFTKVMRAKAPPALAPASMIQLGLLGLLYTYHHPVLRSRLTRPDLERS